MNQKHCKYIIAGIFTVLGYVGLKYADGPVLIGTLLAAMIGVLILFNLPSKWIEDSFATISSRFKISAAIAGGFFLAVASSSPEFFTAASGVVWYRIFDIGFDTLIWSGIFNLCVIISVGTFFKSKIVVRPGIIKRDMPSLGVAILVLLFLALDGAYSTLDFLILIALYLVYLVMLYFDNSKPYKAKESKTPTSFLIVKIVSGLVVIMVLAHAMVSYGQETIGAVENYYQYTIPIGLLACTIYGPGTSFADLFMSIAAIKKGEDTAAIVNGISSNTFDLTICIGIPGLMYTAITGNEIVIDLNESILLISMLLVSFLLVYGVLLSKIVTRRKGYILLGYYLVCMAIYLVHIF